jgi:hypothetical protein
MQIAFNRLVIERNQHLAIKQPEVASSFIKDVVGNPFCPVTFAPEWRTSDVIGFAEAIYSGRAFYNMPIFADALEEAGCDDENMLKNCRSGGPHVRGNWVLDLVLGKS